MRTTEPLSLDTFERARNKAAGNLDLLELIDWIEIQTSLGVSSTQAAQTWAARKSKEPLIRLDDAMNMGNIFQQPTKAEELE